MPISPRDRLRLEDLIVKHFRDEGLHFEETRKGSDRVLFFCCLSDDDDDALELNITALAERLLIEGLVDA